MGQTVRHFALVIGVALVVLFTNLGGPRLWDRDEPRNAGCTAEMLARWDWVTPVFNAQLRTHKPILLYWLMMTAYGLFGVNEFAARFPSAVLAMGTVLATYGIGRRLFHPQVGLWSAVILATTLMFDVAGRAATPDSTLIFFSTGALLVYVLATFPPAQETPPAQPRSASSKEPSYFPRSWSAVAVMYAWMGVAVLAKGPVGLVLPTAVIGMFLLVMRAAPAPSWQQAGGFRRYAVWPVVYFFRTCWHMRPVTAVLVVLAVALPWYAWVGLRTEGQWLKGFFLEHNLGRALQPMEGHAGSVLLFYPLALLVGFFPWSVFLGPTLKGVISRLRQRDPWTGGYVFAACWIGVYVGLFSLVRTKLPSYITPGYPGMALLTGCFVYHWYHGRAVESRFGLRLAFGSLLLAGVALTIGLAIAASLLLPGEEWLAVVGLIPVVGALVCWYWSERGRPERAAVSFAVMSLVLTTTAFAWLTQRVDRHQQHGLLLAEIHARSDAPQIGSFRCLEPSWVFYSGHPIRELALVAPSPTADIPRGPWLPKPRLGAGDFIAAGPDRFILTTDEHLAHLQDVLPQQVGVLAETQLFLKDEKLLLLGWKGPSPRTAQQPSARR